MSATNTAVFEILRAYGPLTYSEIIDELKLTGNETKNLYRIIGGFMRSNMISFKTVDGNKKFYLTKAGRHPLVGRVRKYC